MQEHEYIHDHGYINGDREVEEERQEELIEIEDLAEIDALEEKQDRRATVWVGRSLVIGLGLSFLACLAALWLSGTLLSAPDHLLPMAFLRTLAANRILLLCAPVASLVICYAALRSLTVEVMAVPERYLDERQKMLRDRAHRSAFKMIKFVCLLIPCGFLLPHLPWFNQTAPVPPPAAVPLVSYTIKLQSISLHVVSGNNGAIVFYMADAHPLQWTAQPAPPPAVPSATTAEVALAGGLLLLGLFLMASALPMAVLAWKGEV